LICSTKKVKKCETLKKKDADNASETTNLGATIVSTTTLRIKTLGLTG
jgi:hypothetical protein